MTVVPTAAALEFVGAPTWAALSGKPVATDVWSEVHQVPHVRIGQQADLVVVAPATADLLAKAAHGLADDLLTNTLLTARCPVVFAPAMHTEMWEHAATRANVATLRERGCVVVEPAEGRLTGSGHRQGPAARARRRSSSCAARCWPAARRRPGPGRSPRAGLGRRHPRAPRPGPLPRQPVLGPAGLRAGPRRGRPGRGGHPGRANVALPDPAGVKVVRIETTAELLDAITAEAASADAVVMAAAPADFRPTRVSDAKIKKSADGSAPTDRAGPEPRRAAPDQPRPASGAGQVIVGFAAETGDDTGSVLELGRAKLARKGCDLLVVNDVSGGAVFGSPDNEAVILGADGAAVDVARGSKSALAHVIWDEVVRRLAP